MYGGGEEGQFNALEGRVPGIWRSLGDMDSDGRGRKKDSSDELGNNEINYGLQFNAIN